MMTAYLESLQKECITAQQNVSLKKLCSFQIGGNARVVVYPDSTESLCRAVSLAVYHGLRFFIVGKGSNLLFADEGFDGVIICTGKVNGISIIGSSIRAECGVSLGTLSRLAHEHSLTGFEFAHGIPGNCGGAVFMNAGAFGHEICEILESCTYFDARNNRKVSIDASQLQFSYRHSMFMEMPHLIILNATFRLQPGDMVQISTQMSANMQARKERQPLGLPNAGSIFKRPAGTAAGKLIDDCGLKGVRVGGAEVSTKHAGFIVNFNHATAQDVLQLMHYIQTTVYETYQIQLEPEIRYIV
jgi:UDP-N-acetylmuramate dehydrogenase